MGSLRWLWRTRKGLSASCSDTVLLQCIKLFVWLRILQIRLSSQSPFRNNFIACSPIPPETPSSTRSSFPGSRNTRLPAKGRENSRYRHPQVRGRPTTHWRTSTRSGTFKIGQCNATSRNYSKVQSAKQLPPSTDNRRIITTLSDKILPTAENRTQSVPAGSARSPGTGGEQRKGTGRTERREDIFYPYKVDFKLKSLQKIRQNIEKKEQQLRLAEKKVVYFPRLKTTADDRSHEKTMQNLIERQDRLLASKKIVTGRFKHAEFMDYLSRVKAASSLTTLSKDD